MTSFLICISLSAEIHAVLSSLLFRRYGFHGCTCEFSLTSHSAGTISAGVRANSPSPPFPQVRFPRVYVRILPHLLFRRYGSHGCTCEFSPTSFSAGTVSTGVRANSPSPPIPQVLFPRVYVQILPHLLFRRYGFRRCTCEFTLTSFSAGTISAGVRANSPSPPFPQVRFPRVYVRILPHLPFRRY